MRSQARSLLQGLAASRMAVGAIAVLVVLFAAIAAHRMPLQLLPEVHYPQIRVIGDLPGQTSSVIEESINEPLEATLGGTPGLVRMESRSGDGRSYIDLFFEPDHDLVQALREVSQGVQQARAQMPAQFPEPRIFEVATTEEPAMQYAFGSNDLTAAELRQLLRSTLLPRLRSIEGVDTIFIGREEDPELVVEIDPLRQRVLNVTLDEIETTLLRATAPPVSDRLLATHFDGVGVLGEAVWDPSRLMARPLGAVAGIHLPLPLREVAHAYRTPSETSLKTRLDGDPAVLVTIHRSPRAQSLRTAAAVRETVETVMGRSAFADVRATLLFDDSVVTEGAVRSVMIAAAAGSVLAMGLVFVVLRQGRRVLLVGAVVIVSLSAALLGLAAAGMSLNLLTLAGLLISVGLSLDYAIIYFDRLEKRTETEGDASIEAMLDVASPLLGALLTTVAAIAPFLLVQGLVAKLFQPLILTVILSSVFAYCAAFVLLPIFSGARVNGATRKGQESLRWSGRSWRVSQKPWVAWPAFALLCLGLVAISRLLPFEVLPTVDDGFVDLRIVHPAGISPDHLDELTRGVERALMDVEGTGALFTTVGGYFREGLPSHRPGTANFMVRVETAEGRRPSVKWADDARAAIGDLGIHGLSTRVGLPRIRGVRTRLSEADIEVVLTRADGDLIALADAEIQVAEALRGIPGLSDVERLRAGVSPRWRVEPDYPALSHYGVAHDDLEKVVSYTMNGAVLRQRMEGGDPLALRVRYDRRSAGGPHDLARATVPAGGNGWIHLAEVARFNLIEEPTHIERRENQRVVRVGSQLAAAGPGPGAVAAEVEATLAALELPDGVNWWLEGEIEALQETRRSFGLALGLAVLVVFTVLLVQYGSVAWALAGWLTIPLCGLGSLLLLWAFRQPLDAMVLAGLLISVGIVANSAILVLSETHWKRRETANGQLPEALASASRSRLRPIGLTVASTVLGMSPLLFGGSEVFGLLRPLAIALTGALLISIPIACVLLPAILMSIERAGNRSK